MSAFLIDDGGELSLVDTLFEGDARLVLDAIRGLGRSVTDLKRIAITHGHRSHLGGLAALKRASGATVYAHALEADIVSGDRRAQPVTLLPKQSLRLIPFQLGLWLEPAEARPLPRRREARRRRRFRPVAGASRAGSLAGPPGVLVARARLLIAGDAIATWPSLCAGWTAFKLNRAQHADSLRRMAALERAIVGVGHGDPIVDGAADEVHRLASQPLP